MVHLLARSQYSKLTCCRYIIGTHKAWATVFPPEADPPGEAAVGGFAVAGKTAALDRSAISPPAKVLKF